MELDQKESVDTVTRRYTVDSCYEGDSLLETEQSVVRRALVSSAYVCKIGLRNRSGQNSAVNRAYCFRMRVRCTHRLIFSFFVLLPVLFEVLCLVFRT